MKKYVKRSRNKIQKFRLLSRKISQVLLFDNRKKVLGISANDREKDGECCEKIAETNVEFCQLVEEKY